MRKTFPERGNLVKKSLRVLAVFGAILISFGVVCGVSACAGRSDEQIVQDLVNAELDKVKNADEAEIEEYLGTTVDQLAEYGIDPTEVYKAFFGKFDYVDNGATVDGNTATVSLTITNVDVEEAASSFKEQAVEWMSGNDAYSLYTSEGWEAVQKKVYDILLESFNAASTKTAELELTVYKDSDGEWSFDMEDDEAARVLFAGGDIYSAFDFSDLES